MPAKRKGLVSGLLKIAVSAAILGWLFHKASQDNSFDDLLEQPKQWTLLVSALGLGLVAIATTFYRWFVLVRLLDLPFRLKDAFRLGFIGYLFNFLTLGVLGGDTLKAVFIAREQPGKQTEAVYSVVIDRVIGLYALCVVAAFAFWLVEFPSLEGDAADQLSALKAGGRTIFAICFAAGGFFLAMLVVPGLTGVRMQHLLGRLPVAGDTLRRLTAAAALYRRRAPLVLLLFLLSLGTHFCFSSCVYLIAVGLSHPHPAFDVHFAIVPIANVFGSLPLPGGLGGFEFALDWLYRTMGPPGMAASHGFVVALGYRLVTLVIAGIGVLVYLSSRRDLRRLMDEESAAMNDSA